MTDSPCILYVDDDSALRRLVQRALERRGFDVELADSAESGLAMLREKAFDLVAIDHYMPGKDGLQMLGDIATLTEPPPVVFVTGTDEPQVAVNAMKAGAADFVIKTVGESFFDLLANTFRQALDRVALQRANQQAEADLRQANDRLETLLREVHHRVSNSLQMVSSFVAMQAAQTSDPSAREALAATQTRIQAVSQVHRRLYTRSDIATIDLDEYLSSLVDELRTSLPRGGEIALTLHAEPVDVPPDQAVSIGVIVNELVGNAAKYAFRDGRKGTIDIALTREAPGAYEVTVGDDGEGFESGSSAKGTGLGMRIVDAITRSMRTKLERVERAQGTCHRVVISTPD